jgi:cellulose biosynthesis protein BcsQ
LYKKITTHSLGVVERARELWKENVFPFEIPESIAFPRAFNDGKPLLDADPEHPAAIAYLEIAKLIHPVPLPVLPQEALEDNEQIPS